MTTPSEDRETLGGDGATAVAGPSRISRRRFLWLTGAGSLTLTLAGCGDNDAGLLAPEFPPFDEWLDRGPLEPQRTLVRGVSLHALVATEAAPANAPPLVLIHGSGLSGRYMIPTARELAADFPVYVPDIPGYGDSGDPGKVLNIPQMSNWLVAWMEAIGLERASFLGNSFGCQVIVDLAMRYPERVNRLILQGPTTPPDERSTFWQFIRWRQNEPYNPEMLGEVTAPEYGKAGLWRMIRSYIFQVTDPVEEKVRKIEAPTLVIRGEHDPITHQAFAEMLVRRLPHGELLILPDVAHTLVFTAPLALADATRSFMEESA
ncbi:MAG: alpha/beta hydrolase [Halomonas sp.]|jgi:2-hydroxy-6-oxonona-2,4-dienedioate hydrolase|uniref:Alpha/beta hydrolase n=1 Tax=Billgrantia tianxiuensis TaxID=2497861 RepID=A0A6I6SPH4_9GAMM|nr:MULTISPECIES: alpha/beta hydrolase [Halomonas]MCE8032280.1 alpha/beta hydrolase [Halomonas sp. MCCC 1A11057]MDX5433626.1 alpha/beta hydrolase [Halomonas sp.]QHC49720.1 alpha/beta hydrolase [Halomonas tianxiuensis]